MGGRGDDQINVRERDRPRDVVDCGPGTDSVAFVGAGGTPDWMA